MDSLRLNWQKTLRMDKVNDVLALFGDCLAPVKNDSV